MKKVVLILAGGFQQLKAQQNLALKPGNPLMGNFLINSFKPKADSAAKMLFVQPNVNTINANGMVVYSRMPVVNTSNIDHMPVVVPGDPNTHYTMMIKKVTIIDPLAPPAPTPAP